MYENVVMQKFKMRGIFKMLIIPNIKTVSDGYYVAFGKSEYKDIFTDCDYTNFKLLNDNFTAKVNGRECPVMECRVSKIPFNTPWPGKQRDIKQTESAGYISFYADEAAELFVKSEKSFEKIKIRPTSAGIEAKKKDGGISFVLTEYGSYTLELDGTHNVLHIFYNPIKEYPDAQNATYYF